MKHKNSCILIVFFCGMFLLQIWVAQAESKREPTLEGKSSVGLRAINRIMQNPAVIDQKFPSLKESNKDPVTNPAIKGAKKMKKASEKDFVWYNPWTWF